MLRHSNSPTSEEKLMAYIYDDVDDSDIFTFKPLQDNSNSGDDKVVSSEEQLELINENSELKAKVKILEEKANLLELRISEIYKTAKAEIERKDRRIRELNQEKDDVLFRRNRNANQYHKGANNDYHHNPTTYQSPEVNSTSSINCKLHDKDKEVGNIKKASLEKPISISSSRSEREIEENRGLTTKNISMISSALTSKLSEEITKPEVATETVNQQTSEENSSHPSSDESRKHEKSDSPDIIIIDDSEEGDSEKSKTDGIETFTACSVVVSKSEQKLVNNHIDAQSIKAQEKRPAARVTRSKSDYQPRHVRTPSPDRVKSPVFEKMLKRDTKNDNQTLDCRLPARTRSEHQRRMRRTPSPRSNKLPRTPPDSPPRSRAVFPKSLKRPTSNSPSRRKTSRLIYNSPPRRAISPYHSKRTKSSCRANNSPSRRARSRSPPRSFRDRGRPRSVDRKRWMTDDNRRRSRSRGNDTREHQHRRERERSRHVEEAVKERNLKVDRHGNAIETYRDWKNKKLQEQTTKAKEDEMRMSADQELADLFREGGGSETPLFGSETGSNFDDIQSDNEPERVCSRNNKGKEDEATECRTALNTSELSEAELERMLQIKLKELNSSSLHSEFETSNVSPSDNFVQISQRQEECRKSSSFSDNDLRTKLSKKRKKSEDTNNQNVVDQNKNDDEEKRLYGLNNGATKTQRIYGSIIEEAQKIRVRESRLLKNSVTDSTKIKTSNIIQVEESNPVEKNKKKIGIDDYKKRNEGKHSADDLQQEPTDQKPHLTQPEKPTKVKETLPVSPATEKIDNTDTLPDKPYQRIRIIEDRVVSCAKTVVKQTTEADLVTSVQTESKQDIEIDIEVESNSLPGSGQDKGSFLNDFDFSLSEDEFLEKKSAIAQGSVDENKPNGQVEQNITQESRPENVSQKVEKESLVIQSSSKQITTNDPTNQNLKTAPTLKEPKEQQSSEPETECIENIQEAIHKSTINPEPATIIRTAQLNTEELQKCLEDDDDSVAKSNNVKPKTVREQIILLFGSDSPATPEIKKATKPRKTEAQKACRNLTNLGEDSTKFINAKANENESFRVRDKASKTKEVPEITQLKSEEKESETCPVFCNNPNYIPVSPNSRKQLADYIEKGKKHQPDKEETKEEDNEEEPLDETNDEKKSSKGYKRKPFKIKMPFPNQEGKKQSNDSKKRKRPAKPKTKNPKSEITEPEDDSFTATIKNIVEAEKRKCTKPKKKKSSKKLEQTDPTLPGCDEVKCNDSLKEKSLKRITPIKVGEVSGDILITSNKRKLINTKEQRPEKIQKIDTGTSQTSNQSPLPHMEEMLKHLERKATPPTDSTLIVEQKTSYVYTNIHNSTKLPRVPSSVAESTPLESLLDNTINQIHLDSKDVSMLGSNERVIFDNIQEYLGDKSLATFDTVDKTLNVHNKIKECSSHFDFSNMLQKSVTTSTPLKQDGLTTSKMTKTYLTSPLKRDKRRRIAIKVVDLPKM